MKNVTIALDDETHRNARIRAAELGTSLSALVKEYLTRLAAGEADANRTREMEQTYNASPSEPQGPPYFINGEWVWTKDGKPRQPGSLRHLAPQMEQLEKLLDQDLPDDMIEAMKHWDESDFDSLP